MMRSRPPIEYTSNPIPVVPLVCPGLRKVGVSCRGPPLLSPRVGLEVVVHMPLPLMIVAVSVRVIVAIRRFLHGTCVAPNPSLSAGGGCTPPYRIFSTCGRRTLRRRSKNDQRVAIVETDKRIAPTSSYYHRTIGNRHACTPQQCSNSTGV